MEFKEVVKYRYSCKKYSERKVDRARLNEILEAGRLAPTAKNLQEQHIYVVESEENLAMVRQRFLLWLLIRTMYLHILAEKEILALRMLLLWQHI